MRAIKGEDKLAAVFGEWPSFHDAEVWTLAYERVPEGFAVVAVIHVFEMTAEVNARGQYVLRNHSRVRIRFDRCSEVAFNGFNHQNVLSEFRITECDQDASGWRFQVRFDASYGLAGSLLCEDIVVEEVLPWMPPFGVHAAQ